MKKFLGKLVLASMVLSMAAVAANAADPTILIDFKKDIAPALGGKEKTNVDIYEEADHYEFLATGNDPYVSMDDAVADDAQDCVWVKIRVLNKSAATAVEFFAATSGRSLAGNECTHVNIEPNTDSWKTYIAYVPDANVQTVNAYKDAKYAISEFYWEGTVDWIRLDPMWQEGDDGSDAGGNMESGDEIWFDYVAFFKTEEDAIAFRDEDCTIQKGADFATVAHKKGEGSTTPAATEDKPADTTPADTTPADTTPADETPAAQTADVAAIAVLASVLALGTAVVISKKR